MNNFELAQAYVTALTGDPNTLMDWRCINDKRKDVPAHNYRGTLYETWATLQDYNNRGYGIFCTVNAMDGIGRELSNVHHIRAHVLDLDNPLNSAANYERATKGHPSPTFAVQTSPGKFHIYWCVEPYTGNEFYTIHQKKICQLYDGDKSIVDATRVLRVPGFYHHKNDPFLVTCWGLSNARTTSAVIQESLASINIIEHFSTRAALGDPTMAAPSLDWLKFALSLLDPNQLDRSEWVSFSAAIKQAGWNHTDEQTLLAIWQEWCARYSQNDAAENMKLWNSVRDTEVGWPSIERRTPVQAYIMFGHKKDAAPPVVAPVAPQAGFVAPLTTQEPVFGEILAPDECQQYFKDCFFVARTGEIFNNGRFLNSTQFNGLFGGKHFIITSTGKITDEAWKAATRSTCWMVPKVDHVRFLPDHPPLEIVEDEKGRKGVNTYMPARIKMHPGDVSPFLDWFDRIMPNKADQKIYIEYMAHAVKYPGYKIPWCPLLQSVKGIGKTMIEEIITHSLGSMYVYKPPAPELIKSGSTFNGWMRGKLMIIVDEIKVDERRELAEILKPFITQSSIQIQSKGVDQEMEDNPANWMAFSNHKDAMPVDDEERRYCIFFSTLQSFDDIENAGMDRQYFINLYRWLREGGKQAVAHYLHNYPIEKGGLDIRAPHTSSYSEALRISRSPMEVVIHDCLDDALPGFRGGYISSLAVMNRVKASGIRPPSIRSVEMCMEKLGYVQLGRAIRSYAQEDMNNRAVIFAKSSNMSVANYGITQGYE